MIILDYGTSLGDDAATCGIWLHAVAIKPNSSNGSLTLALVYKSRDCFFLGKKNLSLGIQWGSNPHTHISSVMLYQLSYQALGSKVVGRKGIQVLVLGAHSIRLTFLIMEHPWVTMLHPCIYISHCKNIF